MSKAIAWIGWLGSGWIVVSGLLDKVSFGDKELKVVIGRDKLDKSADCSNARGLNVARCLL